LKSIFFFAEAIKGGVSGSISLAGEECRRENFKEEIEIKHIIKPRVMEEGVWEIPIRRHHLSYSPILLPRNQFDFALAVGLDVSFHMRVKRFKVRYI
jgi:hypothetical protein